MNYKYLDIFSKKVSDKVFIYSLFVLILVLALLPFILEKTGKKEAILVLRLNDQIRMFEGETIEGMTILDALNASVSVGNISFKYAIHADNKTELITLDGGKNLKTDFSVSLNSKSVPPEDINRVTIKPGDKIEIRLD